MCDDTPERRMTLETKNTVPVLVYCWTNAWNGYTTLSKHIVKFFCLYLSAYKNTADAARSLEKMYMYYVYMYLPIHRNVLSRNSNDNVPCYGFPLVLDFGPNEDELLPS